MQVQIGSLTVTLVAPRSFTERQEIIGAAAINPQRAFGAALGRCWPKGPTAPKARYEYEPLGYGGAVLDELLEAGHPPADVYAAAARAWRLIADAGGAPRVAELEGARGNSEAPPGA